MSNGVNQLQSRTSADFYLDTVEVGCSSHPEPTILSTTSGFPCGPEVCQNSGFRRKFGTRRDHGTRPESAPELESRAAAGRTEEER